MVSMNRVHLIAFLGLAALTGACGRSSVSYGTTSSIIVTAPEELWEETGDSVMGMLEPTIFTVRDERAFDLTYASPASPEWETLRQWKRLLIIGQPEDPWVAPVLSRRDGSVPELPALVHMDGVWARGQEITLLLLPAESQPEHLLAILPELHEDIDTRFRQYVRQRMYVSGPDTVLRADLRQSAGFSILLPQVYERAMQDSVYLFRNDHPTPGRLERSLLVTWTSGTSDLDPEAVLDWRDRLADRYYVPAQVSQREPVRTRELSGSGSPALEIQGVWSTATEPGEVPSGGPFINRVIRCPEQDRTYFLDAWLYAPREKKYEYMLQLQTILNTFECGRGSVVARR